jgi:hypothetical protein
MKAILVSGYFHGRGIQSPCNYFCQSYKVIPNPLWVIGKENGSPASFAAYIMQLLPCRWFEHGSVLILDNVAIHSGGNVSNVEDYLWDIMVAEHPLNVLTSFLPTRSPELNSIALVFLAGNLHLFF